MVFFASTSAIASAQENKTEPAQKPPVDQECSLFARDVVTITPSELDYDVDAVKGVLDSGQIAEAYALAHRTLKQCDKRLRRHFAEEFGGLFLLKLNLESAKTFFEIAIEEPSAKLDVYSPFARFWYERFGSFARKNGLIQLANQAENRAAEIKSFENRWRVGTVSDAEAKAWLNPLHESYDLRLQSAYYSDLAKLRLTQKRNKQAVAFARKALVVERKLFAANSPTQQTAGRLVDKCWSLGVLITKGGSRKDAIPVFRLGHNIAKRFPVMELSSTLLDPHRFRVALAEVEGTSLEEAFNSRFDSALDELTFKGPYDYLVLHRASDLYVECIEQEAEFFFHHNRHDLAVKVYEREIPIMLSKIPDPDPFRGAVFANYNFLLQKAKIHDPLNKSVPTCNTCGNNHNVVSDYPRGHRIIMMYHWRCEKCNNYI